MFEKYDRQHRGNLNRSNQRIKSIINEARRKAVAIALATGYNGEGEFHYGNKLDDLLKETSDEVERTIRAGIEEEWQLSASKASVFISYVGEHTKLTDANIKKWTDPMQDALRDFENRKVATMSLSEHKVRQMNLSSRVWNLSGQFKEELELAVEAAMAEGMGADELSRKVRRYLNEPNRLFRRVRDKSGALRLSRAAQAYHPGTGVYRSSYMNATRMAATEINTAYRTADYLRWKTMPFVLGIEIRITDTHRHVPDMCDELKGKYPKDFKFVGWHPWCRCYAVPILPSIEEFATFDDGHPKGEITDVPGNFKSWVARNFGRIKGTKSLPFFLQDNKKYI